jgi:hypothetical protein
VTATDELRRLLDERGVEYKDRDMYGKHVFHWGEPLHGAMFTDGGEWTELVVENASPEQAIAATLGVNDATRERQGDAGTCKADETERIWCRYKGGLHDRFLTVHVMECSACGGTYEYVNGSYEYCPRCGRRVVE